MQKKLGQIAKGENTIANKIIATMLVITLTFANFILLGVVAGKGVISYAAENLEGQNSNTQHSNVKFDAYFMKDGVKTHSLKLDSKESTKLYFALNVKDKGYFKNGSIEMKSPNYKIAGELEASEIMQKINGNVIQLKQINYGTEAIVDLPIALEIANQFALENVNKESSLILKGTYVTGSGEEVAIEKEIKLNITWTSENKFGVESQISKYKIYEEAEKVLLQETIKINKTEKALPIAKTKIEVEVPNYKEVAPEKIIVQATNLGLTTGQEYEAIEFSKNNWNYNATTGKLTIEVENKAVEGNVWAGIGEDEYTVTYIYGKEAITSQVQGNTLERKAVVTIYTYNGNEIKENKIEKEETTELPEQSAEIITGKIAIEENISKGYMYANANSNNREYVTNYSVKEMVEIPYIEGIESIKIEGQAEQFIDEKENKNSTKIGGVNYTAYTKTVVDQNSFYKILGQDGYIVVKNGAGKELGRINKGNYELAYTEKQDVIVLETSAPIAEGNLFINHEKVIKADLPYLKNQLVSFKQLEASMIIGDSQVTTTTSLEETSTKVDMTINKQTINKEENVEIKLELNSTNNTSDLYVNPKFAIELPEYISNAEIRKAEVLFDEELKVKKAEVVKKADGKQELQVELTGTQTKFNTVPNTKGTTVIIQASLTASKTGEGKAKLTVENKNAVNYATNGTTEVALNAYVMTFLDITLPTIENITNEETNLGTGAEQTPNQNEQINNENNEETEQKIQYLKMEVKSNEFESNAHQKGEKYIYEILLENTTPEDLEEELEWSEEDMDKLDELNAKLDELEKNENLTEEQLIELDNIYAEMHRMAKKYARGELKEYYELTDLKEKKEEEFNKQIKEYETLNKLEEPTEEQTKRLTELKSILNNYILAMDKFNEYAKQLSEDNLTQEQEEKLKELGDKLVSEEEKLKSLTQEQEVRLTELEGKLINNTITNTEDTAIRNVVVKLNLPKYVTYKSAQLISETGKEIKTKTIEYDQENNAVILKLEEYTKDFGQIYFNIETEVGDIGEEYTKKLDSVINLQYEQLGKKIEAKEIAKLTIGKMGVEIIKTTEGLKEKNKVADEITFKLQAKNIGGVDCYSTKILFKLPEGLYFQKMYYGIADNDEELEEEKQPEITEDGVLVPIDSLLTNQTAYAYVTAIVEKATEDKDLQVEAIVKYKAKLEDTFQEEKANWNVAIEKTIDENNPDNPDNPDTPNKPGTYSISGYAWNDKNEDGLRAERDKGLKDVKAILVNIATKQTIATIITDENGSYKFNSVEPGEYQIIFEYDSKEYNLTEYKKTSEEEINSNAIKVAEGTAITDVIKVTDKNIQNINIGLVDIPKFDMNLSKKVSKITVQNKEGTKTYSYNDAELAKVEINGKYINGTNILVEYKIKVTNEGELAGTVEKIVDYMPKEMTFSSDLNSAWVQDNNGNLYNTELSKIVIEPGESKEITLVLKKKLTEDDTGTINNRAEIALTSNKTNTPDFDSTPGNQAQGEDDISTANVIVGIKTGAIIWYMLITIISLAILGTGIYTINKRVIKRV